MLYFMACFANLLKYGFWPTLLNGYGIAPVFLVCDVMLAGMCIAGAVIIGRLEGLGIDDLIKALKRFA